MHDNDDFWLGYMLGSSDDCNSSGGGDGSGIKAVLCVIGGLVLEALFLTMFNIEVSDVPTILLVIGWMIGSGMLVFLVLLFTGR